MPVRKRRTKVGGESTYFISLGSEEMFPIRADSLCVCCTRRQAYVKSVRAVSEPADCGSLSPQAPEFSECGTASSRDYSGCLG